MTQTLQTTTPRKLRPIKVRHSDGTTGWAAKYGTAGFGGVQVSVFASYQAALNASVSDDTGPKVIARHVHLGEHNPADWHITA